MPGLACLNRLCAEPKSKSSPVCVIAQQLLMHSAERQSALGQGSGIGAGARAAVGMTAGGHQNVCSWQQSDTWRFPRRSSRQGCSKLGLSVAS